jgi:hypothetical protein
MPKVKSGKSKSSYISNCMAVEAKKFPDRPQRFAVCNSLYEQSKKKKK